MAASSITAKTMNEWGRGVILATPKPSQNQQKPILADPFTLPPSVAIGSNPILSVLFYSPILSKYLLETALNESDPAGSDLNTMPSRSFPFWVLPST